MYSHRAFTDVDVRLEITDGGEQKQKRQEKVLLVGRSLSLLAEPESSSLMISLLAAPSPPFSFRIIQTQTCASERIFDNSAKADVVVAVVVVVVVVVAAVKLLCNSV